MKNQIQKIENTETEIEMTKSKPDRTFGMFVGIFNEENHCKLSVKKAKADPDFYELYLAFKKAVTQSAPQLRNIKGAYVAQSTKSTSYQKLKTAPLDTAVLNAIRAEPDSRAALQKRLKRKEASICGAANRLIKQGLVRVVSHTLDEATNCTVEVLGV